ncbi:MULTISPECIES: helix-turn-helix transcriptional regulator [Acidovorax]|uniref:Helix-turn-helix domain-containing protein n=2 Tax=Betaproteobacteria TaxID=28216 RepID=A0ABV8D991_9BURK|nr:helix-turn-helix transcriptional regulator [Acidovorax sp. SD340]MBO1006724.1 helix-turn-helix transcriptional regulator [Acidovorax sp. SD340]MCO4240230.1 helix-turn-helix domain-containing protein [Acidovorax facilis]
MTTLSDVAEMLRSARREAGLSQDELAQRAGVARTTVARMENLAKGDMSVSALVRLLEAAGYDLKLVKPGHVRTVDDILAEQRRGDSP